MRLKACLVSLAVIVPFALFSEASVAQKRQKKPVTGFEKRNGESWTTHKEELKFLADVDRLSQRVKITEIGKSVQKRPLHLVRVGAPRPPGRTAALRRPTILFVCTQHGNEPAPREGCLQLLRDLAFTKQTALVRQLKTTTILFIPTANPDGRVANDRQNANGVDINRDHLTLETPEARAIAKVVRDYRPEIVMDHHEYGPSIPALYDDEILYLWPRNLNVHKKVHDLAKTLGTDYIKLGAEERGYSADEYGQYALADQDIHQAAGDGDEGIARNAMGLRHTLGILIESAVTADPRNGPQEVLSEAEVNLRRVESHLVVAAVALEFMRERGNATAKTTAGAFKDKAAEGATQSAPVYFGGADNDPPEEEEIQDPPPCRYELTGQESREVDDIFELMGIRSVDRGDKVFVPMGQPAEPVIPLILDERGERHSVAGKPIYKC
ncbi:MAG: M14 family metallocarboxypeptidase [Actinomycetota bacterium]|nr:M14 family metallocarboxypeptidase [Actinomycetota bacterium]